MTDSTRNNRRDQPVPDQVQYAPFRILDTPYCAWGWDLRQQNLQFLDSIDHQYYDYIARTHIEHLKGEHAPRAATALRAAYLHGLETFFCLLGAAIQAPGCLAGWVHRAKPYQVRSLVRQIHSQQNTHCRLPVSPVTWHSLAKLVHSNLAKPEDRKKEIHEAFGRLWHHFASDFLEDLFLAEYNSFKHGFRARAGGFVLKAGIEPSYGVSPPESEMQVVGGSEFGASFFVLERIEGSPVPAKKLDHHFHLTLQNLNWRPESMLQALQSLSMSVNNLVSFLKIISGRPGKEQPFHNPEDLAFFDQPWQWSVGTPSMRIALSLAESQIRRFSNDELLDEIAALNKK